jgi:hypothetical protein
MSPTARSMAMLKRDGWTVGIVERWIAQVGRRSDLFGFADLLAIRANDKPLLLQVTTAGHVSDRLAKCRREPNVRTWLRTGSALAIHGWHKVAGKWTCRVVPIVLDDCDGVAAILPPRRRRRPHERSLFDGMKSPGGDIPAAGSVKNAGASDDLTGDATGVYDDLQMYKAGVCVTLGPEMERTA